MLALAASPLCPAVLAADDAASPLVCVRSAAGPLTCVPRVVFDAQRPPSAAQAAAAATSAATAAAAAVPPTQTLYLARLSPNADLGGPAAIGMLAELMARGGAPGGPTQPMLGNALGLSQASGSMPLQIEALGRIGRTQAQAGDYPAALKAFNDALALARKAGELEGEAAMHVNLGAVQAAVGAYLEALDATRKGHDLYRDLTLRPSQPAPAPAPASAPAPGDRLAQIRRSLVRGMQLDGARRGQELALLNLGAVQAYTGQYAESIASYNQALALYPAVPSPDGAALVLRGLAQVSRQLGRVDEAAQYAQRAARAGQSLIEIDNQSLANGSITLGRSGRAAVALPGRVPAPAGPDSAPAALAWQAPSSLQLGQFESAAADAQARSQPAAEMAAWRKAALAAGQIGSADGQRNALAQLQRLCTLQQQAALAVYYGKRAVNEIQRQRGDVLALDRDARRAFASRARPVYETLVAGLRTAGRLPEAEQAMRLLRADAVAEFAPGDGRMPYSTAEQALLQHDQALALRWRQQAASTAALQQANPYAATPTSPDTLAQVRQARLDAVDLQLQALEDSAAPRTGGSAAPLQAMLALYLPQLEAQFKPLPCAVPASDARIAALATRVARLRTQLQAQPAPAGPGLARQPMPAVAWPLAGFDPLAMERLWCAQQQQTALEQEAGGMDAALLRGLQGPAPAFAAADAALLDAGRQALAASPAGTVALHYLVGDDRLTLLLVSARDRVAHELPVDRKSLDALVSRYREVLSAAAEDPLPPAQALHRLLLAPLLPDLDRLGARTLILATDGSLRHLPFAALHDGQRWLVERFAIVSSGAAAAGPGAATLRRPWRVAGFGSTLGGPNLHPLPAVAQELRDVVRDDAQQTRGPAARHRPAGPGIHCASLARCAGAALPGGAHRQPLHPGRPRHGKLVFAAR